MKYAVARAYGGGNSAEGCIKALLGVIEKDVADGWRPQGGIAVVVNTTGGQSTGFGGHAPISFEWNAFQAMVKEE